MWHSMACHRSSCRYLMVFNKGSYQGRLYIEALGAHASGLAASGAPDYRNSSNLLEFFFLQKCCHLRLFDLRIRSQMWFNAQHRIKSKLLISYQTINSHNFKLDGNDFQFLRIAIPEQAFEECSPLNWILGPRYKDHIQIPYNMVIIKDLSKNVPYHGIKIPMRLGTCTGCDNHKKWVR